MRTLGLVTNGTWLLVTIMVSLFVISCNSQFISHINARGIKGNISFAVRNEDNGSILVIQSIISIDGDTEFFSEEEKQDFQARPVHFDWFIHNNILKPSSLYTCPRDDLGSTSSETLRSSLTKSRPIILNKQSEWLIPLKNVLEINEAKSLSSLIWGKSISLRLSEVHQLEQSQEKVLAPVQQSGLISKPSLTSTSSSSKPTFAPRAKPSISARLKTTSSSPRLPRAEPLILETTKAPIDDISSSTPTPKADPSSTKERERTLDKKIWAKFAKIVLCGNIIDTRNVKSAEAVFETQVAGRVTLRGNEDGTTLLMMNLYHIKSKVTSRHDWKILSSDILDNRRHEDECKYLELLFDPDNADDSKCDRSNTSKCKMGDLSKKHGQIQVAGLGKSTRVILIDENLPLSALEGSRSLFLVIYETSSQLPSNRRTILSCAQIRSVKERKLEASFNMDGVRGFIRVSQRHLSEPAIVSYDLFGLEGNVKQQSIRELPLLARTSSDNSKLCTTLGDLFNPFVHDYKVGNLSARHGALSVIDSEYEDHYMGEYLNLNLQLYEHNTIAGRSIVLHKNNGDAWVCANFDYIDEPVSLAVANFYYPVVGSISLQQLTNDPYSETGVLIEVYNPNSEKDSSGHNWMVHLKPAMADFYNWSQRCESSGEIFDPLQVATSLSVEQYNRICSINGLSQEPLRCKLGDVSTKSGIRLSLPVSHLNKTRYYYTDPFLPLTKSHSVIGKSIVIYDEHAPTQRGNRLACSTIKSVHPLKASIKAWNSGPSIPSAVTGSVVFEQESAQKATRIKIDLNGLNGNVENYAIHNVWTMDDREFPCSNDSLYNIYDPYDSETSLSLPPTAHYGSSATVDRVKVGDMSRKHGTFDGLHTVQRSQLDGNAPLFAPHSIVGRSLVLRAAVNDFRWVCGNIELEYDKSESRQIIGLASFDEPRSKIAGFVRFTQLEHKDGSLSDTYVQVDLKMATDGIHELQTSENHNWAVFVNQVGEDAYIAADEVRCIASGFKWNPYLAQDNLETYPNSCNPSERLACAMGDLGMRHGSLTLGPNNRRSVSDSNLPLTGNYSVMGRSLIIFDNKRPSIKLACANIFPDIHLKSNVVIKRTPTFTVARFVEQMRDLLGAAEWLMVPELKATKPVANGECVQMTIHFYGQKAHQMQIELNNLITLGTVRKSTRVGTDKISTHYKLCRAGETNLKLTNSVTSSLLHLDFSILIIMILFNPFPVMWLTI